MTKLSIITICYNEPHVGETCESIINQTWQDFEWIVIDGGSNKETIDIINKYKTRINKYISEPDNGIYDAYNKGIKKASGKYIIFMNAGDCFNTNDVLNIVSSFFDDNANDIIYGQSELISHHFSEISNFPVNINKDYFINGYICTQSVFIKKELFDRYGVFDDRFKIVGDYERYIMFAKSGAHFKYIPVIVSKYDMHGISANPKHYKLRLAEINNVKTAYYTQNELEICRYSLKERLFSIRLSNKKTHKVVTILGIKFKIKIR